MFSAAGVSVFCHFTLASSGSPVARSIQVLQKIISLCCPLFVYFWARADNELVAWGCSRGAGTFRDCTPHNGLRSPAACLALKSGLPQHGPNPINTPRSPPLNHPSTPPSINPQFQQSSFILPKHLNLNILSLSIPTIFTEAAMTPEAAIDPSYESLSSAGTNPIPSLLTKPHSRPSLVRSYWDFYSALRHSASSTSSYVPHLQHLGSSIATRHQSSSPSPLR